MTFSAILIKESVCHSVEMAFRYIIG